MTRRSPTPCRPLATLPLAVSAILFGLVLTACPRVPPADLSRDPQLLLAQVRAEQQKVIRVQGRARVSIHSPRQSGSASQWIAAEKPDRLHLETLDFFGNVAAVLVADGRSFSLFDARTSTYYRGEPTPENVSRLLPVVLSASDLVAMLCGSAPVLPGDPGAVEVAGELLDLEVVAGGRSQALGIGERAAIERSRMRRGAAVSGSSPQTIYDLEFSHFRTLGATRFPVEARLEAPREQAQIDLTWSEVELNGTLAESLFRSNPPQGARVVELSPGTAVPELRIPLGPAEERRE
jgi:hypothetical protein